MPDLARRFLASELLEPGALALLLEIHRLARGGETEPTTPELAGAIGVSPRQVVRLIRSQERGGWITTTWSRSGRWIALAPGVEAAEQVHALDLRACTIGACTYCIKYVARVLPATATAPLA